ncbi:PucR family transcriptional regulator [Gordonia sp. FQ]|uniref:PucR family transcriptional regulator n=1 Tax=Gordonia sp. FQ TaxID=3446634 RepID=UPI003F85F5B0
MWSLADPDRSTDSARHAWDIGRRHARAGIPLPVVSQGFRIGAAVVWDRLVELISAERPELVPVLARCANEYWQFCERDQRLMMEAYRLVVDGDVTHIERKLLPVLRMLLRGHADNVDCESAAVALDVPHDGRYVVARISDRRNDFSVNDGFSVDDGPIRDEIGEVTIFRCRQRHGMTLVVHLGDRSLHEVKAVLAERFPNAGIGISPVVGGLSALGQANQHAGLAERIGAGRAGMTVLSDRIPEALLLARPDLASVHLSDVLGPVLDLDATERDTLLHTMQTWMDVGGSTAQAAKALFCHTNTVLNRLRRFERLTGRHLESPGDLVDVALALRAYRLMG